MKFRLLSLAGLPFVLAACVSTSNVLETGRDTFTVSSTSDGFRSAAAARESAYEVGHSRCHADGKHFQMLTDSSERTRMGIDTTVTVTFRCLSNNDPDYQRPNIKPAPTVVIEDQRK